MDNTAIKIKKYIEEYVTKKVDFGKISKKAIISIFEGIDAVLLNTGVKINKIKVGNFKRDAFATSKHNGTRSNLYFNKMNEIKDDKNFLIALRKYNNEIVENNLFKIRKNPIAKIFIEEPLNYVLKNGNQFSYLLAKDQYEALKIITAHEAGHILYFRKNLELKWRDEWAKVNNNADYNKIAKISGYCVNFLNDIKYFDEIELTRKKKDVHYHYNSRKRKKKFSAYCWELFAEITALKVLGANIDNDVLQAYQNTVQQLL